ncbi:MAG: HIT family protein [Lachnospiraceae bacterium]|nr:HIT family protein [Lachnospiraceae bacterium]
MIKDDCIFCKIIKGDIPSRTLYEDDSYKVIMDIEPADKGHALILPKDHYADLYEIPEDLAAGATKLAKKLITEFTTKLNCDGYNILQNNKEAAGQTVSHYHVHLIPRYADGQKLFRYEHLKLTSEEMDEIEGKIKK